MIKIKLGKTTAVLSIALLPAALLLGQAPGGTAQTPPSAPAAEQASPEEIIETYGFIVGLQSGLRDFDLTEEEYKTFLKGLNRAQAGEEVPANMDQIVPQLQSYLGGRQAEVAQAKGQANREKAAAFFADLEKQEGVEKTPEGVYYKLESEGTGERPEPNSTVLIHYEGKLIDGTVFDSSRQRGEPAEFALTGVIPGMAIGLQQVREGGEITLYIPAELAYGDQSQPTIPPGSALIFEVELIEVREAGPAQALPGFSPPPAP